MGYKDKAGKFSIVFLNIVFVMIVTSVTDLIAQGGDEILISIISQGAYGEENKPYLIFPNIIFGGIISVLQSIFSFVNCYVYFQILLSVCAFILIGLMLVEHAGVIKGALIWFVIVSCCAYEHYVKFQFTQNAFFYCSVGIWGIFYFCLIRQKERGTNAGIAISILFLVLGYSIRSECLLSGIPFAISISVLHWKKICNNTAIKKAVVTCMILLVFCTAINQFAYSNDGWKEYKEYNPVRAKILDYGIPPYEDNAELYQSVGLSQNDYQLLSKWCFADMSTYSYEAMNEIAQVNRSKDLFEINVSNIKDVMRKVIYAIENFPIAWGCLGILVTVLYYLPYTKWWKLGMIYALMMAEYWYLVIQGRTVYRAQYGIWLFVLISEILIWLSEDKKIRNGIYSNAIKVVVGGGVVIGCIFLNVQNISHNSDVNVVSGDTDYSKLIEWISADKEHLYLMGEIGGQMDGFSLYDVASENSFENLYYLGGWLIPTPIMQNVLDKYEVINPFQALADGEEIYYIDSNNEIRGWDSDKVENIRVYIKEHYGVDLDYTLIKSIGTYSIYQFHP